jgi:hypothetical protein
MNPHRRNPHLTHQANTGTGRHGWLRLTPAYSVRLVRDRTRDLPAGAVVTDPFSGSGTTVLAAAEHGGTGTALDVNPFLVWLGNAKTADYPADLLDETRGEIPRLAGRAAQRAAGAPDLWAPKLHNIGRWWSPGSLDGLKALRSALDDISLPPAGVDLLSIAFCRTVIAASNAAFNHQSMSFKAVPDTSGDGALVVRRFAAEADEILRSAETSLPGTGRVVRGDARHLDTAALNTAALNTGALNTGGLNTGGLGPCDVLLTSPPYVNRMSYIRELRPYMYWLRFLDRASDAGELDWTAIGGTWGSATSRLSDWSPPGRLPPVEQELSTARTLIARDGGRNGPLLATYVAKYFHDMAAHFSAAFKQVRSGGTVTYIIGNSTFYGHLVPAERWYAALLSEAGFTGTRITTLRKRNSNAALYEYEVTATRP